MDTGLTHRGFMTGVSARVESFLEEGVENQAMEAAVAHSPQGQQRGAETHQRDSGSSPETEAESPWRWLPYLA